MRTDTKMIIHINLPENFAEILSDEMEKELEKSSKKWGVYINYKQKETIFNYAKEQVRMKTSDHAKNNWDFSDQLTIRANSHKRGIEITLPAPEDVKLPSARLFYTRDGWELDQEKNEESIELSHFADFIQSKIKTWARTAVFYGVGSYSS